MTDQPVQSAAMREFVQAAGRVMAELLAEHKRGQHYVRPYTGCPSCVFGEGRKP